jgi:hypothetical protein
MFASRIILSIKVKGAWGWLRAYGWVKILPYCLWKNEKISFILTNLIVGVPRKHMLEPFDKLLRVIQRYFTCEGRFNKVYKYHIRLLLHFTCKKPIKLPYYLCRILGNMENKVHTKTKQIEVILFHFYLIKLLVLEELKKTDTEWEPFLASRGLPTEVTTLQEKKSPPSSAEKIVSTGIESSKGKQSKKLIEKSKENEAAAPGTFEGSKRRSMILEENPKRNLTRSVVKRLALGLKDIIELPVQHVVA